FVLSPPDRGDRRNSGRTGLLAGWIRREGVRVWRRRFLRRDVTSVFESAGRVRGGDSRRPRVLAGGRRRLGSRLRRRTILRLHPSPNRLEGASDGNGGHTGRGRLLARGR